MNTAIFTFILSMFLNSTIKTPLSSAASYPFLVHRPQSPPPHHDNPLILLHHTRAFRNSRVLVLFFWPSVPICTVNILNRFKMVKFFLGIGTLRSTVLGAKTSLHHSLFIEELVLLREDSERKTMLHPVSWNSAPLISLSFTLSFLPWPLYLS